MVQTYASTNFVYVASNSFHGDRPIFSTMELEGSGEEFCIISCISSSVSCIWW